MADKVVLETVEHVRSFLKDRLVHAAVDEEVLRAEHFGHFGQDRGSSHRRHKVGESADRRVGRDAGQTVGSAALHADYQLADRDLLALKLRSILRKFLEQRGTRFQLIRELLAGEEFHSLGIVIAKLRHELIMRKVLAAQVKDQNRACVGVPYQRRQEPPGLRMVMAGLRASEGMCESIEAVYVPLNEVLVVAHQCLGDVIHTADSGNDPDLVAACSPAVLPSVAHEGLRRKGLHFPDSRLVVVLHFAAEVRGHVVGVDPLAGLDLFSGMSNGQSVFHDHFADCNVLQCHLVPLRDLLHCRGTAKSGADRRGMEGDCYVINIIDLNKNRHVYLHVEALCAFIMSFQQCFAISGHYRQSAYAFRTPSLRIFSRSAATAASKPSILVRSSPHIFSLVMTAWVRAAASSSLCSL